MKEKVRPIYEALQGCLSSAPLAKEQAYILESPIWEHYHRYIDKLGQLTGEKFDEYKVLPFSDAEYTKISVLDYRTKLNSLIMALHGKFFNDEPPPFSGAPGVVVSQLQQQSQSMQMQVKELIHALIKEVEEKIEDSEEKKSILKSLKDLTTNETFASVTGAAIGEILKRVAQL